MSNSTENSPPFEKFHLLVIDDEAPLLEAMQEILETNYFVKATTDAQIGLAMIEKGERFDCIICDLMLPQMNGMQFYEQLGILSPEHQRRVIFMTGGSFTQKTDVFLKKSEIVYCEKPMKLKELEKMIHKLVLTERNNQAARAS